MCVSLGKGLTIGTRHPSFLAVLYSMCGVGILHKESGVYVIIDNNHSTLDGFGTRLGRIAIAAH